MLVSSGVGTHVLGCSPCGRNRSRHANSKGGRGVGESRLSLKV